MGAIKISLGQGQKYGPRSGHSGVEPGRRSSHTDRDDPHDDDFDEATHEAAKAYASAMKSGDTRAILRTGRTLRQLESYHEADED